MPQVNLCDRCARWNRDCLIHPAGDVRDCTEHRPLEAAPKPTPTPAPPKGRP